MDDIVDRSLADMTGSHPGPSEVPTRRLSESTENSDMMNSSIKVATPEEFVKRFGGTRVINKVLIANNGIAAVKCIRSIRRWSYETFLKERAIKFVVMVTPEDLKANAEYIKMADYVCQVKGGSNNNNYANVDLIVSIAKRYSVEAVWAGWGHASENPKLPEQLSKSGIMFMGPSEHAMWLLGDKIASSIVAQTAGVPTMPWSGSGLVAQSVSSTTPGSVARIKIPKDLYRQGCVHTLEEGLTQAQKIGYPIMIKASEGGGGKGIRRAESDDEFQKQYPQVLSEVPGSPVFIMKLAANARHLEVQLLADEEGTAISIFGRDCSIQRRHQKIIEEAPVVIANKEVFREMEEAAVRLAELVGYRSTGTVEYLYDTSSGKWFFLELNPRLQVEHPCTEMVSNVNLPAAQLMVAMGIPLHRIKSIRQMYGVDPYGTDRIEFRNLAILPEPSGHVISARITSENPDEGFKPSAGTVHELNFKSNKNVWGYFSVSAAGGLHEFADSQFGHCFSWGEDREQARENLVVALKELSIRGDFRTIVEHLVMLMEKHEFLSNSLNTGWLDAIIAKKEKIDKPNTMLALICGAINVADQIIKSNFQSFQTSLERGQTQPATFLKNFVTVELIYEDFKYSILTTKTGPSLFMVELNGTTKEVEVHQMTDGILLVSIDGLTHTTYMQDLPDQYRVVVGIQTIVFAKENDPTVLLAPSTGKLVKFLVADGCHVDAGQPYCEIEVMKMITTLQVNESGMIQLFKRPGAVLESGSLIAKIALDDPNQCRRVQLYSGPGFPNFSDDQVPARLPINLHQGFLHARQTLEHALAGYCCSDEKQFKEFIGNSIKSFLTYLNDPRLPLDEMKEILASIQGRIPYKLERTIGNLLVNYEQNLTSILVQFPAQNITAHILDYLSKLHQREKDMAELTLVPILDLCSRYKSGIRGHMKKAICELVDQYLKVETLFQMGHYDKVISTLQSQYKDNIAHVVGIVFAHTQYRYRNIILTTLLDQLWSHEPRLMKDMKPLLRDLTNLVRGENSTVSLKARTILIASEKPSYEIRHNHIEKMFLDAINKTDDSSQGELKKMINDETSLFDVLGDFFYHTDERVRSAALEVYVRRAYTSYDVVGLSNLEIGQKKSAVKFDFLLPQSHPNRSYNCVGTGGYLSFMMQQGFLRHGLMVAFEDFDEFKANHVEVLELLRDPQGEDSDEEHSSKSFEGEGTFNFRNLVGTPNSLDEPSGHMSPRRFVSLEEGRQSPDAEDKDTEYINLLSIALKVPKVESDNSIGQMVYEFCQEHLDLLIQYQIRRLTCIVLRHREFPKYFTFRARNGFCEDVIYRHLEPALAFQLELNRLKNYDLETIPVSNHKMHLYLGKAKVYGDRETGDYRFFIRSIIRHSDLITSEASFEYLKNEGERLLLEALDELEMAFSHPMARKTDCNHIFLNFVPTVVMNPEEIATEVENKILHRYASRLLKLKVKYAEIRMAVRPRSQQKSLILRLCISSEAGYILNIHIYQEVPDPDTNVMKFAAFGFEQGPLHGLPVSTPYMTKDYLETKRSKALAVETTFVYDYPDLFKVNLKEIWKGHFSTCQEKACKHPSDSEMFHCIELVLDNDSNLVERKRYPGENNIAMVAWKMTMKTPEYPDGREIIVIANDITIGIGSFGPIEDLLFLRASELARKMKVPRIYLAANSGARIGIAREFLPMFKIAWEDDQDPEKGFKYLYLSPEDYSSIILRGRENGIQTKLIQDEGESRYQITAIIGHDNDIGVENLSGAAWIAGETSQSYNEIVTISMVSSRAIGIGAYLVRLGQRVVQIDNSSIILTGASALNKLLGREVYSSNAQLGGTQIMHNNGVSHKVEKNDVSGIRRILTWLSYIPKSRKAGIPIHLQVHDPVDRFVTYSPRRNQPYDPRWLLNGRAINDETFETGLLDENSFDEIMSAWAQSVVTGRGRLGGIPVGVIAVETRPIDVHLPADPANPNSEAKVVSQAGQVWYPDSAYKTAQAIFDFHREDLPLIILANWRGFSGGMKDMYEQVIKFGAMIVDALRAYKQPILIYIPPYAELRGGSWVVIDPSINKDQMEMYADPTSRGGVLEAEGTVSIKLRLKDQRCIMERLDPEIRRLNVEKKSPDTSEELRAKIETKILKREEILAPMYHQVAVEFVDLHDTPIRMKEKGVIREIIPWKDARKKLFWRLRRKILENELLKKIEKCQPKLTHGQIIEMIRRWFIEDKGDQFKFLWDQDEPTVEWILQQTAKDSSRSSVRENLKDLRRDFVIHQFKSFLADMGPDMVQEVGIHLAQQLPQSKRTEFAEAINKIQSGSDLEETFSRPNQLEEDTNLKGMDDSSESGDS